ncbi:MAG: hypothetical protein ACYS76_02505 [Planctomycetota bacterium]|jgi:dTDP-4-dehydrorhamnose 3,5-epimerase
MSRKIAAGVLYGWMCVSKTKACIADVASETYNYSDPDQSRTDPHDNDVPYQWAGKDG